MSVNKTPRGLGRRREAWDPRIKKTRPPESGTKEEIEEEQSSGGGEGGVAGGAGDTVQKAEG